MTPVVTLVSPVTIRIICSPPTVAGVGVTGAVVLAICIRIELGAPARIVDYMLRRGRGGKRG
jgi:hypothetical protein